MRRYNLAYYFLTMLLIMGGFAAMAQNSYGLIILGLVAVSFGLIFLYQLFQQASQRVPHKADRMIEWTCLFLCAVIFACKLFYIEFPFLDSLFQLSEIVLIVIYTGRLISQYRLFRTSQSLLAIRLLIFYGSVILFIAGLITVSFNALIGITAGAVGLILFIAFLLLGLIKKQFSVKGEDLSATTVIARRSTASLLLASLLSIFTLYWGLTHTGILPQLYSDKYPQAYFEMIDQAATGKEKPVDGTYRYQVFKKNYDEFVKRMGDQNAK